MRPPLTSLCLLPHFLRLADQRGLAEFEKMVLGQPLSQQLQDEIKRTIAVRNMPAVTTEATVRRVLDQIPGGIRNVAMCATRYQEMPWGTGASVPLCYIPSRSLLFGGHFTSSNRAI